jgi:hypothetical protein
MDIDPRYPEVSTERREELLVIKGELEAQAPKGAAADPFVAEQAAKQAKAAQRGKTKAGKKAKG